MGQTCSRPHISKTSDESKDEIKTASSSVDSNRGRQATHLTSRSPLFQIPTDVRTKYLNPYLTTKDMGRLATTSKQYHADYHSELTLRSTKKLLTLTVKGQERQAKTMLEANPKLLLINSATTTDYSGKHIHDLTPFQAALCAGDVDMVKMMQPFFAKLDDGDEQMAQQIQALFPKGFDAHLTHQLDTRFDFRQVFNAIRTANDHEVTAALDLIGAEFKQDDAARRKPDHDLTLIEAMNRFRESFAEKSLSEQKYNPQHLLKAMELYSLTFEPANRAIWDRNWDKRDLFWRQIVGFCQRFVPACTAQAFAQGLYYLVKVPEHQPNTWKAEDFNRSLKFRYGDGSMYPVSLSRSGLGFSFATYVWGDRATMICWTPWTGFSKNLFQSSQQVFAQLYQKASLRHGMHALNNAR